VADTIARIAADVSTCRACPRLVAWREQVAAEKRRSFIDDTYWGRGVPGFGDAAARLLLVGLAPAAHGANRTGRMFTGDRSGDWLFRALHRAGFANQPEATGRDDGLALHGAYVTSVVHCAPPQNKPTAGERDSCIGHLHRELAALDQVRVVVALGKFGWDGFLHAVAATVPRPRPVFTHGAEAVLGRYTLLGSYHPSQQNTFTKRLTEPMFDGIFTRAREVLATV
jgi:uracil-DNA glycosylase family 4